MKTLTTLFCWTLIGGMCVAAGVVGVAFISMLGLTIGDTVRELAPSTLLVLAYFACQRFPREEMEDPRASPSSDAAN